jgi:tape measure domain-containing protein
MSGVILDVDSDSRKARADLEQLNQSLAKVFASSKGTGDALDKVGKTSLMDTFRGSRKLDQSLKSIKVNSRDAFSKPTKDLGAMNKGLMTAVKGVATLATGMLAIGGINSFNKAADDLQGLETRLKLVSNGMDEVNRKFAANRRLAKEARTSTAEAVQMYSTLQRSLAKPMPQLGGADIEKLTGTILKAGRLSGSSVQATEAAFIQLQQGLAAGVLRGQEFNSVVEQIPYFADALADSLGKSIGELRKLSLEGQLTTPRITKAILNMSARVDQDFTKSLMKAGEAASIFKETVALAFGELNRQLGTASGFARNLMFLNDGVERFVTRMMFGFANLRNTLASVKRDMQGITKLNIAAKAIEMSPFSPSDIVFNYRWMVKLFETTNKVKRTYDSLFKRRTKEDLTVGEITSSGVGASVKDVMDRLHLAEREQKSSFGRMMQDLEGIALEVLRFIQLSAEKVFSTLGRLYTPVYRFIGDARNSLVKFISDINAAGQLAAVPFYRTLRGVSEYLEFWRRDTNVETAWSVLFSSSSIEEFKENLIALNKVRAAGPNQNWAIWSKDGVIAFREIGKSIEGFLIQLDVMEQRAPVEWRFLRVDKFIQTFQILGGAIDKVYVEVIRPRLMNMIEKIVADLRLIGDTFEDSLRSLIRKDTGAKLGAAAANIVKSVLSAIKSAITNGAGQIDFAQLFFTIKDASIVRYFGRLLSYVAQFVKSFTAAFADGLGFTKVFDRVVYKVREFADKVIFEFWRIYDEVIAHSWWTDTVESVVDTSKELWGRVSGPLKSFSRNVIGIFKDIYDSLPQISEKLTSFGLVGLRTAGIGIAIYGGFAAFFKGLIGLIGRATGRVDSMSTSFRVLQVVFAPVFGYIKIFSVALALFSRNIALVTAGIATFTVLFPQLMPAVSSGMGKSVDIIQRALAKIITMFREAYVAIVGNSYWPDTIDEVNEYTGNLAKAESRVGQFAKRVSEYFKNIGVDGAMFSEIVTKIKDVGSALANLDLVGIVKRVFDNLGATAFATWLLSWENAAAKISGMFYFAGLFNLAAGDGGTSALMSALESIFGSLKGMAYSFAKTVVRGILKVVSEVIGALPDLIRGALSGIPLFGGFLEDVFDVATAGGNALLTAAIAGLGIYLAKVKGIAGMVQSVSTALMSPAARGNAKAATAAAAAAGTRFRAPGPDSFLPENNMLLSSGMELGVSIASMAAAGFLDSVSILDAALLTGVTLAVNRVGGNNIRLLGARLAQGAFDAVASKVAGFLGFDYAAWITPKDKDLNKAKTGVFSFADRFAALLGTVKSNILDNIDDYVGREISLTQLIFGRSDMGQKILKDELKDLFGGAFSGASEGLAKTSEGFSGFKQAVSDLVTYGLIGNLGKGRDAAVTAFGQIKDAVVSGTQSIMAAASNLFMALGPHRWKIVFGLTTVWALFSSQMAEASTIIDSSKNVFAGIVTELGRLGTVAATMFVVVKAVGMLTNAIKAYRSATASFTADAFDKLWNTEGIADLARRKAAFEATNGAMSAAQEMVMTQNLQAVYRKRARATPGRAAAGFAAIPESLSRDLRAFGQQTSKIFNGIGSAVTTALTAIVGIHEAMFAVIAGTYSRARDIGGSIADIFSGISSNRRAGRGAFARTTADGASTLFGTAIGSFAGSMDVSSKGAMKSMKKLAENIKKMFAGIATTIAGLFTGIVRTISGIFNAARPVIMATLLPILKTVAVITAALSAVGVIGVYFFGEGDTFFEKLRYTYDQMRAIFGLAPTGGVARAKDLLGEIPDQMVGDAFLDVSYAQRSLDLQSLDKREFGYLKDLQATLQEQIDSARREEFLNGKVSDETSKALSRAAEDFSKALSRLPQKKDGWGLGPAASLTDTDWMSSQNSGWVRFTRAMGMGYNQAAPGEAVYEKGWGERAVDVAKGGAGWLWSQVYEKPLPGISLSIEDFVKGVQYAAKGWVLLGEAALEWSDNVGRIELPESLQQYKDVIDRLSNRMGKDYQTLPTETKKLITEQINAAKEARARWDKFGGMTESGLLESGEMKPGETTGEFLARVEADLKDKLEQVAATFEKFTPIVETTVLARAVRDAVSKQASPMTMLGLDLGENNSEFFGISRAIKELADLKTASDFAAKGMKSATEVMEDFTAFDLERALKDSFRVESVKKELQDRISNDLFAGSFLSSSMSALEGTGVRQSDLERLFAFSTENESKINSGIVDRDTLETILRVREVNELLATLKDSQIEIAKTDIGSKRYVELRNRIASARLELAKLREISGDSSDVNLGLEQIGLSALNPQQLRLLGTEELRGVDVAVGKVLDLQNKLAEFRQSSLALSVGNKSYFEAGVKWFEDQIFDGTENVTRYINDTLLNAADGTDNVYAKAGRLSDVFGKEIPTEIAKSPAALEKWVETQITLISLTEQLRASIKAGNGDIATGFAKELIAAQLKLENLSKKISSSDILGVNLDIGFTVDERDLAKNMSLIEGDLLALKRVRDQRSESRLGDSALAANFKKEAEITNRLQAKLLGTMFNTGKKVYEKLSEYGIDSYKAIGNVGMAALQPQLDAIAKLATMRFKLNEMSPADPGFSDFLRGIAAAEKAVKRFSEDVMRDLAADISKINDVTGASFDVATASFVDSTVMRAIGDMSTAISRALEDVGSGDALSSIGRQAARAQQVLNGLAGAIADVATHAKDSLRSLSYESMASVFDNKDLFSSNAIALSRTPNARELYADLEARRTISAISARNDLPAEFADIIKRWNPMDDAQPVLAQLSAAAPGLVKDFQNSELMKNTLALEANTKALRGEASVGPKVAAGEPQAKGSGSATGVVENLAQQQFANQLRTLRAQLALAKNQPTLDSRNKALGELTGLGSIDLRLSKSAAKDLNKQLNKLANAQIAATDLKLTGNDASEAEDAVHKIERSTQRSIEVLQNAANAGVDFFGNVKSSFESGLVDLLSFDSDIEDVLKSFVDSFTMTVIQSFAKGFSDRLFEGVLGTSMESLGSGLFELGAGALGGLFGGKSKEVAGSKRGGTDATEVVAGEVAAETGEDFLSKLGGTLQAGWGKITELFGENGLLGLIGDGLGGIGDMFRGLFSSIVSLFSGGGGFNFGSILSFFGGFFADGGLIRGPGTGTSDSILAAVSDGEFIVNAKATKQNLGLLHALNSGQMPAFATGGLVNEGASISAPSTINTSAIRSGMPEQNSGGQTVINLTVTGDISRQTKSEIYKMMPKIAQGVTAHNREKGRK